MYFGIGALSCSKTPFDTIGLQSIIHIDPAHTVVCDRLDRDELFGRVNMLMQFAKCYFLR